MRIRGDVLRTYLVVHTWTGVIAGLFLFIAFWAGALTMFKPQLEQWANPPLALSSLDGEQLDQLVLKAVTEKPDVKHGFTVATQLEPGRSPLVWHERGEDHELGLDDIQWHASLNESGELVTQKVEPTVLGELIDMLHRTAGIPGLIGDHDYVGVYVLGVVAILYFLALVSGVVVLLPTLVKNLFALRQGKDKKRFWLDAHNLIGITSLPFHIVISLTAIVFAFHHQIYDSLDLAVYPPGKGDPTAGISMPKREFDPSILKLPSEFTPTLEKIAPGYQVAELAYFDLTGPRAVVRVGLDNPDAMLRGPIYDFAYFHSLSGKLLFTSGLPGDDDTWSGLVGSFFALHFGSYGGTLGRWLYFVMGLGGAFLFYTGNLLWLEKRRKGIKEGEPSVIKRSHSILAALTVGCCLGSILGVGVSLVGSKWLGLWLSNASAATMWLYYAAFLGSVTLALWHGAGKAGVWLLKSCVWVSLMIPLTSLLALLAPGLWRHAQWSSLAIELVALLAAWGCYKLLKKTQTRVAQAEPNSVWALKPV